MSRFLLVFFVASLSAGMVNCQRLFLNVMPGFMNYGGDLQTRGVTLSQAQFGFEIGLEYKLTEKLGLRLDYLTGKVEADDKFGTKAFQYTRNLNFASLIDEGSFTVEYDIFSIKDRGWTPYAFAGLGLFHYNPYTTDTAGATVYLQPLGTEGQGLAQYPGRKMYALTQLNVPFGIGVKYAISDDVIIGFEAGARKLFTDYLDDVSTSYANEAVLQAGRGAEAVALSFRGYELNPGMPYPSGKQRGNPGSKDYYYTGLFRLTINLSEHHRASSIYSRGLACPKFRL